MILAILIILLISFFSALKSLRDFHIRREIDLVKRDLEKGRVIYQDSSSGSSTGSSSS